MDFAAYLISKNIDNQKFESSDQALYNLWQQEFMLMSPKSFTAQKLFAINSVRRKYQLHLGAKPKEKASVVEKATPPTSNTPSDTSTKPKIVPSFKKPTLQSQEAHEPKEVITNKVSTLNVETDNDLSSESTTKPAAKPLFKRPTAIEVTNTGESVDAPEDTQPISDSAPKKGIAKPVFKRPENTDLPASKPTELEDTTGEPIKKAAAKPVFKRPEVKTQEASQTAPVDQDSISAVPTENIVEKKPAPKPLFKRPETKSDNAAQTEALNTAQSNISENIEPKKTTPKPVFKRPGTITPTETEDATTKHVEPEPIAEKKIVPKPVFKRPEQAANSSENLFEEKSSTETPSTSPTKKTMPKPIFKRPQQSDDNKAD